ncbi:MAG: OmpA family protein [Nannocystaceae bacterium]
MIRSTHVLAASAALLTSTFAHAADEPPAGEKSASISASASTSEGSSAAATADAEEKPMRRFRPERGMAEVGVFGGIFIFSKTHDFYDPATAPQEPLRRVSPDLGARVAYYPLSFLGVEAEFSAVPSKYEPGGNAFIYGVRAHGILQLPFYRVAPFFLGGYGLMGVASKPSVAGNDVDPVGHYGLGVKYFINRHLALRFDARHFIAAQAAEQVDGTSHFQALLGLSVTLGRKKEAPPPKPDPDRDHDGFLNESDQCPDEAGIAPHGCPDRDSDNDSFMDSVDKCPDVPGVAPDGCPPADRDRDSFLDKDDKCPDEPGVAPDGCPIRDTDGDGILDPDDKCVNEPETRNGYQDADGCPDELPKAVQTYTGVIRGIYFEFNSDKIQSKSRGTLDKTVQVLKDYQDIRIEISGHTDDVGKHDYNVELSQKRADSVRSYLVEHGVDPSRIKTRGAGPDEPIDDNKTAKGRAHNRRIEFKVLTE